MNSVHKSPGMTVSTESIIDFLVSSPQTHAGDHHKTASNMPSNPHDNNHSARNTANISVPASDNATTTTTPIHDRLVFVAWEYANSRHCATCGRCRRSRLLFILPKSAFSLLPYIRSHHRPIRARVLQKSEPQLTFDFFDRW